MNDISHITNHCSGICAMCLCNVPVQRACATCLCKVPVHLCNVPVQCACAPVQRACAICLCNMPVRLCLCNVPVQRACACAPATTVHLQFTLYPTCNYAIWSHFPFLHILPNVSKSNVYYISKPECLKEDIFRCQRRSSTVRPSKNVRVMEDSSSFLWPYLMHNIQAV